MTTASAPPDPSVASAPAASAGGPPRTSARSWAWGAVCAGILLVLLARCTRLEYAAFSFWEFSGFLLEASGLAAGAVAAGWTALEARRRALEAPLLKLLERKVRLLEEAERVARIGAWEQNFVTGEWFWSDNLYHIFGTTPEGLAATGWSPHSPERFPFLGEASYARMMKEWGEAVAEGRSLELTVPTEGRSPCEWVRLVGRAEYRDGKPVRIFGTTQDVSALEEAWRRAERLSSVIENAPCLIGMADPDGQVRYGNRALVARTGRDPTLEPTFIADFHGPQAMDRLRNTAFPTVEAQGAWAGESATLDPNGREFPVYQVIVRHPAGGGPVEFHSTIMIDIAELKLAQETLRTREERLEFALQGSGEGLWDWDLDGGGFYASPKWFAILGYAPEELPTDLALARKTLCHPEDHSRLERALQEHLAGRARRFSCEVRYKTRSGKWIWVGERGRLAAPVAGRPRRMVGTLSDVTRRKEAEGRLRENHDRLLARHAALADLIRGERFRPGDCEDGLLDRVVRAAAEHLGVERAGVWRFSADRTRLERQQMYSHEAAAAHGGLPSECGPHDGSAGSNGCEPSAPCLRASEFETYFDALAVDRELAVDDVHADPRTAELARKLFPGGGVTSLLDAPLMLRGRLEGVLRHEHVGPPRTWSPEERLFASALANLATLAWEQKERRLASEALAEAKEAAEAANRAKSSFLASMSHEIRTPLNGVLGLAEVLQQGGLTADAAQLVDLVHHSAEHLLAVINDILDFSRIEAGRMNIQSIDFDLHERVAALLRGLAVTSHRKGLELVLDLAPDVPRRLRGDPDRFSQMLLNLVGNAVKFTHGGEVVVALRLLPGPVEGVGEGPNVVEVKVRDTGIGIPASARREIFDPFVQADGSISRRFEGTGLGLAIVSQLAKLMGGRIDLESEVGRGSVFTLTAPFETAQAPAPAPWSSEETKCSLPRRVRLEVHSASLRKVLAGWLERFGVEVPVDPPHGSRAALEGEEVLVVDAESSALGAAAGGEKLPRLTLVPTAGSLHKPPPEGVHVELLRPCGPFDFWAALALLKEQARSAALRNAAPCPAAPCPAAPCPPAPPENAAAEAGRKPIRPEAAPPLDRRFDPSHAAPTSTPHHPVGAAPPRSHSAEGGRGEEGRHAEEGGRPGEGGGPAADDACLAGWKVLVVEDNPINQLVVRRLLERWGAAVSIADDGPAALAVVSGERFDAILMDLRMPGLDGFSTLARIREDAPLQRTPVVAVTAQALQGDRERCLAAGFDDYVPKPVRSRELRDALLALRGRVAP